MEERSLATIQKILSLESIPGADSIEAAQIKGWKVVVKKDKFKINDLVVYCEIDSVLPDEPEFEFLKEKHFRIKTIRLRGQVSQGIIFSVETIKNILQRKGIDFEPTEGANITEALGVTKYEPPVPERLTGLIKGVLPNFIRKTDEERAQNILDILKLREGVSCTVTEKLDGASVTYYYKDGKFGCCSRRLDFKEDPNNIIWKYGVTHIKDKLECICKDWNENLALQGELCGPGIQKNRLSLKENKVFFFNLWSITKQKYLSNFTTYGVIDDLDLLGVPIISTNYKLSSDINELVSLAARKSVINPTGWAEGIVIRSNTIADERLSFKVINPEYLLKHGE